MTSAFIQDGYMFFWLLIASLDCSFKDPPWQTPLSVLLCLRSAEIASADFRTALRNITFWYHQEAIVCRWESCLWLTHSHLSLFKSSSKEWGYIGKGRRRGGERKRREKNWCERNTLIVCLLHAPWPGPRPWRSLHMRYEISTRIKLRPSVCRQTPYPLN